MDFRTSPTSVGAVPGPACDGRGGDEPTVTDANVVLGFIKGGSLAGGDVSIDSDTARPAIEKKIARPLEMVVVEAARGIHAIANARMMPNFAARALLDDYESPGPFRMLRVLSQVKTGRA